MNSCHSLVNKYHDPKLVKLDEAPNGNHVLVIFNDGEVVETKGGNAFLRRSMRTESYNGEYFSPISRVNWKMPCTLREDITYSIIPSLEVAYEIREAMKVNPTN